MQKKTQTKSKKEKESDHESYFTTQDIYFLICKVKSLLQCKDMGFRAGHTCVDK